MGEFCLARVQLTLFESEPGDPRTFGGGHPMHLPSPKVPPSPTAGACPRALGMRQTAAQRADNKPQHLEQPLQAILSRQRYHTNCSFRQGVTLIGLQGDCKVM